MPSARSSGGCSMYVTLAPAPNSARELAPARPRRGAGARPRTRPCRPSACTGRGRRPRRSASSPARRAALGRGDRADLVGVAAGVARVLVGDQLGHADLEQPAQLALGAGARRRSRRGARPACAARRPAPARAPRATASGAATTARPQRNAARFFSTAAPLSRSPARSRRRSSGQRSRAGRPRRASSDVGRHVVAEQRARTAPGRRGRRSRRRAWRRRSRRAAPRGRERARPVSITMRPVGTAPVETTATVRVGSATCEVARGRRRRAGRSRAAGRPRRPSALFEPSIGARARCGCRRSTGPPFWARPVWSRPQRVLAVEHAPPSAGSGRR